MGDASTILWTDTPRTLIANHLDNVSWERIIFLQYKL